MFCPNCGYEVLDTDVFCAKCGTQLIAVALPVTNEETNSSTQVTNETPKSSIEVPFVTSIIGLALSMNHPIAGIVLSSISISKGNKCVNEGQEVVGKLKASRIMSRIGLGISICNAVFITIIITIFLLAFFGVISIAFINFM